MTRVIFATVGALAFLAFVHSQAVSVEAPWCAVTKEGGHWDCRYQSAAECQLRPDDVRFTPNSGHSGAQPKCPLSANSGDICHSFDYLVGARQLRRASRPRTANRETAL